MGILSVFHEEMTAKDAMAILGAFVRGKWSVQPEWLPFGGESTTVKRLSWAAFDNNGYQSIGVRPFKTVYFFTFYVSQNWRPLPAQPKRR